MRRRLSAMIAAATVILTAGAAAAQTGTGDIEPVGLGAGPVIEAEQRLVEPLELDTVTAPGDRVVIEPERPEREFLAAELRDQVELRIAEARRRTRQFETAFEKVQRQFERIEPGEQVTVPPQVLDRFERDIDVLSAQFEDVRVGFERLNRPRDVARTRQVLSTLAELQVQLGLLGLRLEKLGDASNGPNALEIDLGLMERLFAVLESNVLGLPRGIQARPNEAVAPELIRPPRGIEPSTQAIRPPDGVRPSEAIIRPPRDAEPDAPIIRPPRDAEPTREVIGSPRDAPTEGEPIRPPQDEQPSPEIIRPPTSENPATSE